MLVLVINSGSSSIKSAVIDTLTEKPVARASIQGIGEREVILRTDQSKSLLPECDNHESAMSCILEQLQDYCSELTAVGHRVVHGGHKFVQPTLITEQIMAEFDSLLELAPLHNASCFQGIRAAQHALPDLPHVAVFDTAFHATLPNRSKAYALPKPLVETYGIRRFGFHGLSHEYMTEQASAYLNVKPQNLRLITCHLGNGSSLAAVEYGRSIDTSMGMTPLEGLVMGSRSGDVDPGVLLQLMRDEALTVDDLDDLLNRESGLYGMTGTSNMQEVQELAAQGNDDARLAIQVFCHRVRKTIGGYAALMGGVDAIVIAGGIGENSALVRHRIVQRLDFLGAKLDEEANRTLSVDRSSPIGLISPAGTMTPILVVATDEERVIARHAAQCLEKTQQLDAGQEVPVAISARHIHLCRDTLDKLFGVGYELTVKHELSQPGQFAAAETVTLQGPRNSIKGVRVLGPLRSEDQIEISRSDEFHLGVDAPVRASGDVSNTPGITVIGPKGLVHLQSGLICAWRHIHMTPSDAERWGVKNGDAVNISTKAEHRTLEFQEVLIRVSPNYRLEMHIDTDEANAAGLESHAVGVLSSVGKQTVLTADQRH